MTAPQNLSFELADPGPGAATGWALTSTWTPFVIADFSDGGTGSTPLEPFDGWAFGALFAFTSTSAQAMQFTSLLVTPQFAETFSEKWLDNQEYRFTWSGFAIEQATFSSLTAETFDVGWGADAPLWAFSFPTNPAQLVAYTPADDMETVAGTETFADTHYFGGTVWLHDWSTVTASPAQFGTASGAVAYEGLTSVRGDKAFSVDPSSDVFTTATAHGLSNSDPVTIVGDGVLPNPLQTLVTYYVRDVTATTFKLALTAGGAAIDITTSGAGMSVHSDPTKFWTTLMASI